MAKVALCWELGKGSGHLSKLADFVQPLKDQGHDVCLIVQNLATANDISLFDGIDIYQAPMLRPSLAQHEMLNYSSILLKCGFDSAENLAACVKAWHLLFESADVEFVVAEHSPVAILSARFMGLPHAMTANGFMVPPLANPMPSMLLWKNIAEDDLRGMDAELLSCINRTASILDGHHQGFDSVESIFSKARQWMVTFPEIDHYGVRNQEYIYHKSPTLFAGHEPVWPTPQGNSSGSQEQKKVFIYLNSASPHIEKILMQLRHSSYQVLAVVPGFSKEKIEQFSSDNVIVQTQLVNVQEVAKQCKRVISHGGCSTILDFLLFGIPSLLIPLHLEGMMLSYRLGLQGLSFSSNPSSPNIDIVSMLETVNTVQPVWDAAQAFAEKYRDGNNMKTLDDIIQRDIHD